MTVAGMTLAGMTVAGDDGAASAAAVVTPTATPTAPSNVAHDEPEHGNNTACG